MFLHIIRDSLCRIIKWIIPALIYTYAFFIDSSISLVLGLASMLYYTHLFYNSRSLKENILCSIISSALVSCFGIYWIIYAIDYVVNNTFLVILLFSGFILLYSVFFIVISVPIYYAKQFNYSSKFLFIIIWIAWSFSDVLKYFILGGFPWFLSAYLWSNEENIIQSVSLFGTVGLSIISYFLLSSMFLVIYIKLKFVKKLFIVCFSILLLIGLFIYGKWRIVVFDELVAFKELSLVLFQTNIPQNLKHDYNYYNQQVNHIITEIKSFTGKDSSMNNLIILPEVTFGNYFLLDASIYAKQLNYFKQFLTAKDVVLLGSLTRDKDKIFNSAYIISKDNISYYHKQNLVPFGEYIPFSAIFIKIFPHFFLSSFNKGKSTNIISLKDNLKLISIICFEALFPINVDYKEVDLIINIANEAWFKHSIEQYQNWKFTKFRAIETGIFLVKVANTGLTGVVNSVGKEVYTYLPYKEIVTTNKVFLKKMKTFFSYKIFILLSSLIILLYVIICCRVIFNNKRSQ